MGPVGCPEGVVDVDLGETGESLCKRGIVLFLFRVEPEVLEENDISVVHRRDRALHLRPDAVMECGDRPVEKEGEPVRHEGEAQPSLDPALRPAQVRAEDHPRPPLAEILYRRQAGPNTGVVGDGAGFVERYVEVGANEHPFARHVDLPDSLLPSWYHVLHTDVPPEQRRTRGVPCRISGRWIPLSGCLLYFSRSPPDYGLAVHACPDIYSVRRCNSPEIPEVPPAPVTGRGRRWSNSGSLQQVHRSMRRSQ